MIVYFIVVFLVAGLSIAYEHCPIYIKSDRKIFWTRFALMFSLMISLSLVFAFRNLSVGTDTLSYYNMFNELGSDFSMITTYEPGYCFLSILIYSICPRFKVFMLVIAVLMFSCIIFTNIKISKNFTLTNILFITLGFYMQSFNAVRQYMALAILLLAICFLLDKWHHRAGDIIFVVLTIVAAMFHKTAVVGFVLLPMKYIKLDVTNVLIIAVVVLSGLLLFPQFANIFDRLLGGGYVASYMPLMGEIFTNKNIAFLIATFVCVVGVLCVKHIILKIDTKHDMKYFDFFAWMAIMFCFIKIVSIFTIEIIDRFGIYFLISLIYLAPITINGLFKTQKNRSIINGCVVAVSLVFMVLVIKVVGAYGAYPYIMF